MVRRDDHQVVVRQRPRLSFAGGQGAGHNGHVEIVARDPLGDRVHGPNLESEIVALVLPAIGGQQGRKEIQAGRGRRPEANAAHRAARHFLHPLMRAVDSPENAPRFFEEHFAGDRQRDAASGTIQEFRSEFILKQRNLM